jgi:hypothetical protein
MSLEDDQKEIENQEIFFSCRFHPTDWFHEVGCEHQDWTKEQLRSALISAKKSHQYIIKKYVQLQII